MGEVTTSELLVVPEGKEQYSDYKFDNGWISESVSERLPFVDLVDSKDVNWSDDLEELHEESSKYHFIDVWTRQAVLDQLLKHTANSELVGDLGCSTGYMLEDMRDILPSAALVGVDMVSSGLNKAHKLVPEARLIRADLCQLPLESSCFDAVVSLNTLEHVADDTQSLREMARVLRTGGIACVVVPYGPHLYDYYDEHLNHERRYSRGELGRKAQDAGLKVLRDTYLGTLVYPPFWVVKKRNRIKARRAKTEPDFGAMTAKSISDTESSVLGRVACRAERFFMEIGIDQPFGIRCLTVLKKP